MTASLDAEALSQWAEPLFLLCSVRVTIWVFYGDKQKKVSFSRNGEGGGRNEMREVPAVRVQLHILGKWMFSVPVLMRCKLRVNKRRASAAVRNSNSHSARQTFAPTWCFSGDAKALCGFHPRISALFSCFPARVWAVLRGAERVTARGFLVLALRSQIRFSTEENPAPLLLPGEACFWKEDWMKRQRGTQIETQQRGKQAELFALCAVFPH